MTGFRVSRTRLLVAACALVAVLIGVATAGADRGPARTLTFTSCGLTPQASRTECATADLPLDYDRPNGQKVHIAVARVPAAGTPAGRALLQLRRPRRRRGRLPAVPRREHALARAQPALRHHRLRPARRRPDARPAIDCKANQETDGIYAQPFTTPFNVDPTRWSRRYKRYIQRCQRNNGDILEHVSTANVARDMDRSAALLGESKLNYFGYSYGTFLGATYASLFPKNYRAMVLDGPIDATAYINKPWRDLAEQTARGSSGRWDRFFQACAADQAACAGFGGSDPWDAYDQLVEQANAHPIPAPELGRPAAGGRRRHQLRRPPASCTPRRSGASSAEALAEAAGRRRLVHPRPRRRHVYGRNDDGTFGTGSTCTSRSAPPSSAIRRTSTSTSTAATRRGASFNARLLEQRLPRAELRALAVARQGRVRRAVQAPELGADAARRRDDVRPGDAVRGALRLVHDLGTRAADHDARRRAHRLRRRVGVHRRGRREPTCNTRRAAR